MVRVEGAHFELGNDPFSQTNLEIEDGGDPSESYREIKLPPHIKGVHRHAKRQILYENIHNSMAKS